MHDVDIINNERINKEREIARLHFRNNERWKTKQSVSQRFVDFAFIKLN